MSAFLGSYKLSKSPSLTNLGIRTFLCLPAGVLPQICTEVVVSPFGLSAFPFYPSSGFAPVLRYKPPFSCHHQPSQVIKPVTHRSHPQESQTPAGFGTLIQSRNNLVLHRKPQQQKGRGKWSPGLLCPNLTQQGFLKKQLEAH